MCQSVDPKYVFGKNLAKMDTAVQAFSKHFFFSLVDSKIDRVYFQQNSKLFICNHYIIVQGGSQETDGFEKTIVPLVLSIDNFIWTEMKAILCHKKYI